jgi:hypothetical protein
VTKNETLVRRGKKVVPLRCPGQALVQTVAKDTDRVARLVYRSGSVETWIKVKNPKAPAARCSNAAVRTDGLDSFRTGH